MVASSALTELRRAFFDRLAGERNGELVARYLKGRRNPPGAPSQWIDDAPRVLITRSQFEQARVVHEEEGGARPNLHQAFQRWFYDDPNSLRAVADAMGRGAWYSVTTAANFYRLLYSDEDYPASGTNKTAQGTAINGWTQWAFGPEDGDAYTLIFDDEERSGLAAWLSDGEGPPPLQAASLPEVGTESARARSDVPPGILAKVCEAVAALEPAEEVVANQLAAFRERFPPDRLARLDGVELLEEMHGRTTKDSLVYWLEFKQDTTFETRRYGSISGGSALKFVVYQRADDNAWYSGSPRKMVELPPAAAAEVAQRQRDQLLAAVTVLDSLPEDPTDSAYLALQREMEAAAPDFHHLAFFHKALSLYFSERLDDYHSVNHHRHILSSLGIAHEEPGFYSAARHFMTLLRDVRERLGRRVPMSQLGKALNALFGAPVRHWRVGTGEQGEFWPAMRDRELVAIGWSSLGDLSDVVGGLKGHEAAAALKVALSQQWPDTSPQQRGKNAQQLWRFYNAMQEGDRVYVAKGQTVLAVGVVTGPYLYADGEGDELSYRHRRRVRWLTTAPFKAVSKTGLMTTVHSFAKALDIVAQAARHLDQAQVDRPVAQVKPARIAAALEPIVAQLRRKGQVILYGPPGTGKTYHALQVAEELVARATHKAAWSELAPHQRSAMKGGKAASQQRIWISTFHPAYGYEDFVEGLKARPVDGGIEFRPEPGLFRKVCALAEQHRSEDFVLIIDEFNRGDAPRIFGELITTLELNKRDRVHVQLPLSGERFSVPPNVFLLATMNTADRSISLLDAALRRRFGFMEFMPSSEPLGDATVDGLHLGQLMRVINERLLEKLGDAARNLQVGHAYFMAGAQPLKTVQGLRNAVRYDLLPLLQEYCAEDPGALHGLLGDAFYDRRRQRFEDGVFQTGQEGAFLAALVAWAPERLGADDAPDEDELDEGEHDVEDA